MSMPTRRNFARSLLAAPVILCAKGAAPLPQPPKRFIIDSHHHFEDSPDYFKRLVSIYGARNAMVCVCAPVQHFDALRKGAAGNPRIVIPYGQINVDDVAAPAHIEKSAAAGFRGIKLHTPRRNWDDPRYFPLYARMQELKLVALFHTDVSYYEDGAHYTSMARMRPGYLDTIGRAFPALTIQGAHLGNPWYEEAAEAARWSPRLYFDLTGSSLIKKAKNLSIFREYLWWQGPALHSSSKAVYAFEKLVFGTDEPPENLDTVLGRYEAMLDACEVPEASRRKIFGETMARILGIPVLR